jgi:hypothetical protein
MRHGRLCEGQPKIGYYTLVRLVKNTRACACVKDGKKPQNLLFLGNMLLLLKQRMIMSLKLGDVAVPRAFHSTFSSQFSSPSLKHRHHYPRCVDTTELGIEEYASACNA